MAVLPQGEEGDWKAGTGLLWGDVCILAESRYEWCWIQSAESCSPSPVLGPGSGVDVFHVEGECIHWPWSLWSNFYHCLWLVFPAWSILSCLKEEGSQSEKSYYLHLRKFSSCRDKDFCNKSHYIFWTGRISGPSRAEAGGMEKKPLQVSSLPWGIKAGSSLAVV